MEIVLTWSMPLKQLLTNTAKCGCLKRSVCPPLRRAVLIMLDEDATQISETALLSEPALADWNRPEEDAAWSHLQSGPWS